MRQAAAGIAEVVAILFLSVLGGLLLGGILWWLSDHLFDAGLWPAGAVLRVGALIGLIGTPVWALGTIVVIVGKGISSLVERGE